MKTQVLSYGGGQQSVAICLLIAQGKLPKPDIIVMADTSREATATWNYLEQVVQPMLKPLSLEVEIASHSLATADMYGHNGDLLMPAYTNQSGKKSKLPTFCSDKWKQRVVKRYLRSKGVKECDIWLGFSLDEIERCKPSGAKWFHRVYPLLDGVLEPYVPWGIGNGLSMSRADCVVLIEQAGLPIPPKSSCWMCPHRRNNQWRDLRDNSPEDFAKAVALDKEIRERDPHVFLHESMTPLDEADIDGKSSQLDEQCGLGFCLV
jgi:hypothetical protein